MKDYISAKISSKYTKLSYIGMVVLGMILVPIFILFLMNLEFKLNIIIAFIFFAAVIVLFIFCAIHLAEARIENNKFYLKKFLRPEKVYDIRALRDLKTFDMGRDYYMLFTMKDGIEKDKFLVYTTRHLLYQSEKLNSDTILREILEENKKAG